MPGLLSSFFDPENWLYYKDCPLLGHSCNIICWLSKKPKAASTGCEQMSGNVVEFKTKRKLRVKFFSDFEGTYESHSH